ncbi:aldo/keto reductase [Tabrizicola oligotrophica]|uniref:Aldo/keto reductase n=1 Tax=Tabrizicola oligotrophica TaxID=2710650 RepID=A0A6M0QTJ2_9RHOB|nr:aldo/keto reductase [Tabrizicola oligotrophica]NEY90789.1 aldo/keto reductase [Tabrizicola oligotrophica]
MSSPLAFGAMQCGGRADAAQSMAMFHACHDAGIRHFDTAWVYTDGRSETLLGQFARGRDLQIATKIGYEGGAGRANLTAQFETSRRRLDAPVDLLYLHRYDPDTPLAESLETLARWQSDGLIARIGLSNFAAWQVMKAQAAAHALGTRIDAIQPMYSLIKRQAEVELLPMAADQGIAVYSYSPLGGGLLSGKYAAGGAGRLTEDARYAARYAPDYMAKAAADLAALAADLGTHPATLAVAWAKCHPTAPIPLISARSVLQLSPSLAAAEYPMTAELYARIAALSPAPPPATDRLEEA